MSSGWMVVDLLEEALEEETDPDRRAELKQKLRRVRRMDPDLEDEQREGAT